MTRVEGVSALLVELIDTEDPIDYLLTPFTGEERERLPAVTAMVADAVIDAMNDGIDVSMTRHNGRSI